ncbi:MAG: aminopeptidase, partial [bacterium]
MAKKTASIHKKDIAYSRTNGYARLSPADSKKLEDTCSSYMTFLGTAKTEREAHDEAIALLEAAGFKDLDSLITECTALKAGDKIYRSCEGKTLMAVIIGQQPLEKGMHIV